MIARFSSLTGLTVNRCFSPDLSAVVDRRFASAADAEAFGETQARCWIEENVARAA